MIKGPPQVPIDNKRQLSIRSVFLANKLTSVVIGVVLVSLLMVMVVSFWFSIFFDIINLTSKARDMLYRPWPPQPR
ncbi:hypothetical protein HanRHA438_Chr02g0068311 [Helianthus annuus]|nr:hypothetical protein HanRHA438_Chr02g0068311 [Helianthus annuus]